MPLHVVGVGAVVTKIDVSGVVVLAVLMLAQLKLGGPQMGWVEPDTTTGPRIVTVPVVVT